MEREYFVSWIDTNNARIGSNVVYSELRGVELVRYIVTVLQKEISPTVVILNIVDVT